MDTEGLSMICAGLGIAEEDAGGGVIGYTKSDYCLDNLKDLQRYLRRDDPQRRDVFKQVCKWSTVSRDLIPILEYYQADRNLVVNSVKVLVFLTMPIDPASDDVSQQVEYLWDLKAAMTHNVTIAVIVSLLEDPLDHLECDAFTEDDWKLVQLVLTLFRNILAIQDVSVQQKASGSATQFLSVKDRFLELMFQENVMDLILVLTQHVDDSHGYLHQDNLLLLEIFYYIFLGQDPELIAKSSRKDSKENGDISTTLNSLRSIMEEEAEKRRIIIQGKLGRHSQFSGTFTRLTVDGAKTLLKGNPPSVSGDGLPKSHKIQRGPLKRTAWDYGNFALPKENILELLNNFLIQFLSGGYNVLMQSVREDIEKEHHAIQNSDVILFFQVAHFVIAFQQKASFLKKANMEDTSEACFDKKSVDDTFHGDICGPIAATMNEAMFHLVISKWREAFEGLKETHSYKSLSAAGSLMKIMIRMLDLVLKLLPEDSKEPHTARILLYKIFYDQTDHGFTHFLLNLFKSFDTHKQPKSDLADLLEIIHVVLRLMEKLQAHGTLRVSRKSRKSRKKKTPKYNSEEAEGLEHPCSQVADDLTHEHGEPASESYIDANKLNKEDSRDSCPIDKEEDILSPKPVLDPSMVPQCMNHESSHISTNKLGNDIVDLACETDSSNDDHPCIMNEADFNVKKLVASFVSNAVVQNLCWLLKHYKGNSASTNHYIICMLQRICDDLDLCPMLYQLSILTIFYDIIVDKKTSMSKEYANIVYFLTKFIRKMLKIMKNQPLLFVEILFWKTRKECHCINAEALLHHLGNLKKQVGSSNDGGETGLLKDKGGLGWRSIADCLGDDEVDFVIEEGRNFQREEHSFDQTCQSDLERTKQSMPKRDSKESTINVDTTMEENLKSGNYHNEGVSPDIETQESSKRQDDPLFDQEQETAIKNLYKNHTRKRTQAFSKEQELEIKVLFEQLKDHKKCCQMIANALDGGNMYTAAQVSRKLRQLGLLVPQRKRSSKVGKHPENGETTVRERQSDEETLGALVERKRRKRNKASVKEGTVTTISQHKVTSSEDSDNETLSTMLRGLSQRDSQLSHEGGQKAVGYAALVDNPVAKLDDASSSKQGGGMVPLGDENVQEGQEMHDEMILEDSMDSGEDMEPALPRKTGFRRSFKMVIDAEDDD